MGKFVFRDVCIYYGGRDLSGELSSLNLEFGADTPDVTTLRDTARRRLAGLLDVSSTHQGWYSSDGALDSVDLDLFSQVGAGPLLISAAAEGAPLGQVSYSWKALTADYSPGASVGEVFAFNFNTTGDSHLARGEVMENAAAAFTFVGITQGTSNQLGAALAEDTIYSSVHVVAVSGTSPTLDLTVESDDADASPFASGVTRFTHTQFTGVGSEQLTLVGPVTDDWWRYVIDIGGTTPSFLMFLSLAINRTNPQIQP